MKSYLGTVVVFLFSASTALAGFNRFEVRNDCDRDVEVFIATVGRPYKWQRIPVTSGKSSGGWVQGKTRLRVVVRVPVRDGVLVDYLLPVAEVQKWVQGIPTPSEWRFDVRWHVKAIHIKDRYDQKWRTHRVHGSSGWVPMVVRPGAVELVINHVDLFSRGRRATQATAQPPRPPRTPPPPEPGPAPPPRPRDE